MSIDSFGERSIELKSYGKVAVNSSERKLNSIKVPFKVLYDSRLCIRIKGQKISRNTKD